MWVPSYSSIRGRILSRLTVRSAGERAHGSLSPSPRLGSGSVSEYACGLKRSAQHLRRRSFH